MRLGLRRAASAPDDAGPGDAARPARPTAATGPQASFAGVVDGTTLWVAVPARPGAGLASRRLVLRDTDSGELADLRSEEVFDQPAYLAARIDLTALDGAGARHDIVVLGPGGDVTCVATTPIAAPGGRTSIDGRTHHALVRTSEGQLRLRTTVLPGAAGLLAVRKLGKDVELTLVGGGPVLAILSDDGDDSEVIASWPVDEHGVVVLTPASVAHLDQVTRPAMTGEPGSWRPVRRRANDLLDPRSAAPLPQVDHPDADRPRVRLPWSREAMLQVRVLPLDEPDA